MAREEVSPPKDWSDSGDSSSTPPSSASKEESKKDDKGDSSIGGPASLH